MKLDMNNKNKGYQTRLELQVLLSLETVLDHEHPKATEKLQDYLKRKARRIVLKFLNRVQKEEEIVKRTAQKLAGTPSKKKVNKSITPVAKKSQRRIGSKTLTTRRAVAKNNK